MPEMTTTTTTSADEPIGGTESAEEYASMAGFDDEPDEPEEVSPSEPAQQPTEPAAQPVEPGQQAAQQPAQAAQPQAAQPTGAQPQVAQQPTAQQPTPIQPEVVAQELLRQREMLVKDIAGRYGLSEEQKELLLTEPEKVLPDMIGRLYVDVFEGVLQAMMAQLPNYMHTYMQQADASRDRESQFYKRWPMLDKPEYKPHVNKLVATYRRLYPSATFEDVLENVGLQAIVALKIPREQVLGGAAPATPAPATVSAPRYRPAVGGAAPTPGQQRQVSEWEELAKIDY